LLDLVGHHAIKACRCHIVNGGNLAGMVENGGLVLAYVVEIAAIVGATLGLLGWLRRRTRVTYRVAALGALGFVLAQVVHLLLNPGLGRVLPSNPAQGVRHEGSALMLGAGHGGIEALIIAGMAALGLVNLMVLGNDSNAFLSGRSRRGRPSSCARATSPRPSACATAWW